MSWLDCSRNGCYLPGHAPTKVQKLKALHDDQSVQSDDEQHAESSGKQDAEDGVEEADKEIEEEEAVADPVEDASARERRQRETLA